MMSTKQVVSKQGKMKFWVIEHSEVRYRNKTDENEVIGI